LPFLDDNAHSGYISLGLMAMKVAEFMRLTQGTKSTTEYLHAFNNLSRYASEFVNTDAKKIASFKRGLSPKMLKSIGTSTRTVFNDFISDSLTQENNNNIYTASKSRKRAFESGPSQARAPMQGRPQYHLSVPGATFRPSQRKNLANQPQQQRFQKSFKVIVP
jgi:hypothetical protein